MNKEMEGYQDWLRNEYLIMLGSRNAWRIIAIMNQILIWFLAYEVIYK